MRHFCAALAGLIAFAMTPLAAAADPIAQHSSGEDELPEARAYTEALMFMARYAEELRSGDRAAIARRYDRRGAWRVGNGRSVLESWADIRAYYAGDQWSPPASFHWRDLSYEVLGGDAVVVTGLFLWGPAGREPVTASYTALLVRQDGELRIRLEDESAAR